MHLGPSTAALTLLLLSATTQASLLDADGLLFSLSCSGKLSFLPSSPVGLSIRLPFSNAVNTVVETFRDRAKCRCPALTESDLNLMYDPMTIVANAVSSTPRAVSTAGAASCSSGFLARDGTVYAGALNLTLPSTCNPQTVLENGCSLQMQFSDSDMSGLFSIKKCTNSSLPQVAVACSGSGCQNIFKPCSTDNDCGSSKLFCKSFDVFHTNDGSSVRLESTNVTYLQESFRDFANQMFNLTGKNVDFTALNALMEGSNSIVSYLAQQFLSIAYGENNANLNKFTFCQPAWFQNGNATLPDSLENDGQFYQDTPAAVNGSGASDVDVMETFNCSKSTTWPFSPLGKLIDFTSPPSVKSWDGIINGRSIHDIAGLSNSITTAASPKTRFSLFKLEPSSMSFSLFNGLIQFSVNTKLVSMYKVWEAFLQKIATAISISITDVDEQLNLLDLKFWTARMANTALVRSTGFLSLPNSDSNQAIINLPTSCSYDTFSSTGKCAVKFTGFRKLFSMNVTIEAYIAFTEKTGIDSVDIVCVGDACGPLAVPQECSKDADCVGGMLCIDPVAYMVSQNASLSQYIRDYIGFLGFPSSLSECNNVNKLSEDVSVASNATGDSCNGLNRFYGDINRLFRGLFGVTAPAPFTRTALKYCSFDPNSLKNDAIEAWLSSFGSLQNGVTYTVTDLASGTFLSSSDLDTLLVQDGGNASSSTPDASTSPSAKLSPSPNSSPNTSSSGTAERMTSSTVGMGLSVLGLLVMIA